jgi:hypothetical protein
MMPRKRKSVEVHATNYFCCFNIKGASHVLGAIAGNLSWKNHAQVAAPHFPSDNSH